MEVLVTAKLMYRHKASAEGNVKSSYFKYHIQNDIGQGRVGVWNILWRISVEELVVYTRKLSCDLLTKIKASAPRNEGRGRILYLKSAILALFLSLSCLSSCPNTSDQSYLPQDSLGTHIWCMKWIWILYSAADLLSAKLDKCEHCKMWEAKEVIVCFRTILTFLLTFSSHIHSAICKSVNSVSLLGPLECPILFLC